LFDIGKTARRFVSIGLEGQSKMIQPPNMRPNGMGRLSHLEIDRSSNSMSRSATGAVIGGT
jgi:hypothetical protein